MRHGWKRRFVIHAHEIHRGSRDEAPRWERQDGRVDRLIDRLPRDPDADALFGAFEQWTRDRGISLYPAQEEALIEVVSGSNVILSTPTGSGKSLVAAGAHFAALARDEC